MKTFFSISLTMALLIIGGVTGAESEEICGTWINKEYKFQPYQKRVFNLDGTIKFYRYEDSPDPDFEGSYSIDEKWTDSDERIWYKVKAAGEFHKNQVEYYLLCRITNSGKMLEFVFHISDYHKKLNPNHPTYRVYYRK